ncbi:polyhydroxyalkanoate synthesis repressor PhaR [Oleisolibacter albus]|uniref:polyhydroxyalkanoate synthesis repressor PhaR n=1 Tax=Oleisolibacter albus TaxID=2171757 RepID=UPI000DF281BD|nr:polyhydroxyalkanoate synthesis repressor PhaR [Oleisolibacter albus]
MAEKEETKPAPVTIKKYANRRLYNTATSSYVTLDHLCQMVKDGTDFVVYDAKTGDDITRSVLTQIIVEEEAKGQNLLPIPFLRQLISFYGDNMQWLVPRYLEHSMQSFTRNQEKMRDYFQNAFGGVFPFGTFEEMGKQNIAMFERAMRMFSPFAGSEGGLVKPEGTPATAAPEPRKAVDDKFGELQKRLDELQSQLENLTRRKGD